MQFVCLMRYYEINIICGKKFKVADFLHKCSPQQHHQLTRQNISLQRTCIKVYMSKKVVSSGMTLLNGSFPFLTYFLLQFILFRILYCHKKNSRRILHIQRVHICNRKQFNVITYDMADKNSTYVVLTIFITYNKLLAHVRVRQILWCCVT